MQCWNNVVTIQNNVATMLQRCVALELVVANRLVQHHLKGKKFVLLIINKTGLRIRMTTQLVPLKYDPIV